MRIDWKRFAREGAAVGVAAAAILGVLVWSSGGEAETKGAGLKAELERIEARNRVLRVENDALKAELARLRSDERESVYHARTELGMVKPGELVYQFRSTASEAPPEAPGSEGARQTP
jgi:cell division protein FtsB